VTASARDRQFCSDASRERGDDNAATATRIDVWILVEVPGTWGRSPLHHAVLPAPVREALIRATQEIVRARVVFIRRRFEIREDCRVYIVRSAPSPIALQLELPSIDDVARIPFAALARDGASAVIDDSGPAIVPVATTLPLVLVCTHGQRDSCCGRRGFPLYDALRVRHDLDVWQCSHIGGDRFAANAVVLPWGLYYGPVEPHESDALADSILHEEILIRAYRGRSSMPRLAQAAETFVRRESGLKRRDALHVIARETFADGRTRVRLRDDANAVHDVTLESYVATPSTRLTCTATEACPVVQFRLIAYEVLTAD
jgi:hypothetical protein